MPSRPIPMQPLVWLPTSTIGSGSRAPSRYSISVPRVKRLLSARVSGGRVKARTELEQSPALRQGCGVNVWRMLIGRR
jgi:hypothetical protein